MALSARRRLLLPVGLLAIGLLVTCSPVWAAWPHNPKTNVPLCTSSYEQSAPRSCPDGAGGAIVVWQDRRSNTNYDLYAQRVGSTGSVLWTTNGVVVCNAANDQTIPVITSDGAGGAIIAWQDYRSGTGWDIYAQRVNASGVAQWTANGVALCTVEMEQSAPQIASDGTSGAVVVWQDAADGNWNIYAQRVNASGSPTWTTNGAPVCTDAAEQRYPQMVGTGSGAIVAWLDYRNGATSDIYVQYMTAAGAAAWTGGGVVVCDATGNQADLVMFSDARGGAFLAWSDYRGGGGDVYAFEMAYSGASLWPADGLAVCTASGEQLKPTLTSDGDIGCVVAWQDGRSASTYDIYAQRLSYSGIAQWTANGVVVCDAVGDQKNVCALGDGAGGAYLAWRDGRSEVNGDIYAQYLDGVGVRQWATGGTVVCTGASTQDAVSLVTDGSTGVITTWQDFRTLSSHDIYAQRIEHYGHLGNPEPVMIDVRDVPRDQGGWVQVEWKASYLDSFPAYEIEQYTVWRRVPNSLAASGRAAAGAEGRVVRCAPDGVTSYYWDYVAAVPARGFTGYNCVAPTTSDSMANGNPTTAFMVTAEQAGGVPFWASNADSGYSVDNLAPSMPAPFTGTYASGTAALHWSACTATDFAEFRLYRGHEPGFVPDAPNLVTAQADTGYVDAAGAPFYYKLCAVDLHGNASPYAFLQPAGTVDVPGTTLPRELALSAPAPNPLRGATTLRLALPRAAEVSLAVYDQQGRRVRTLLAGAQPAGEHAVTWDGRDDGGRGVASGIYFIRCEVEGRRFTRRIAALR